MKLMPALLFFTAYMCQTAYAGIAETTHARHTNDVERLVDIVGQSAKATVFETAYANYCLASVYMGQKNKRDAGQAVDASLEILSKEASVKDNADLLALWAAVGGLKIAVAPMTGMTMGRQNTRVIEKAIELDPSNPTVWLVRGIGLYHTPKMFGGGKDKARDAFNKSIELFTTIELTERHWGHANAYVWRSLIHKKNGKPKETRADLESALSIAPDYAWPKQLLRDFEADPG